MESNDSLRLQTEGRHQKSPASLQGPASQSLNTTHVFCGTEAALDRSAVLRQSLPNKGAEGRLQHKNKWHRGDSGTTKGQES